MQKIRLLQNYAQNLTREADAYLEGARLHGYPKEGLSQEEIYLEKKIITELGRSALQYHSPLDPDDL